MKLFMQRSDVSDFRRRYHFMVLGLLVAFVLLTARLAQLQIIQAPNHRAQARRNVVGRVTLATTRGVIRDAQGVVLAANRPSYDIYVVPGLLDMQETWPRVVQLMGLGVTQAKELAAKILAVNAEDGKRKLQQMLLQVDVSRDVVAALVREDLRVACHSCRLRHRPRPERLAQ